jgi:hypothetical protein
MPENVELRSNSYTKKVPLIKRPLVSFFKLLEVHIRLFNVVNIQKRNVQPVMSNKNVKIVNLLTPQLMAYDFKYNRLSHITFRNEESPNVNNKTTISSGKTVKKKNDPKKCLLCLLWGQRLFSK